MRLIRFIGIVLAVAGFFLFTTAAAQASAVPSGSGMDGRTVITLLAAALTTMIGIYMRGIEGQVQKKMDTDTVHMLIKQVERAQDAFLNTLKDNTLRINQHADHLHKLELELAHKHPTKTDLQQVVETALKEVFLRLDMIDDNIDQLKDNK